MAWKSLKAIDKLEKLFSTLFLHQICIFNAPKWGFSVQSVKGGVGNYQKVENRIFAIVHLIKYIFLGRKLQEKNFFRDPPSRRS